MKREQLITGHYYLVNHSSGRIVAYLQSITITPGAAKRFGFGHSRARTSYNCISMKTGREITLHSALKFIQESNGQPKSPVDK